MTQFQLKVLKKSKVREGITHKPMEDGTLQSNMVMPVLHAWLNLLKWNENLAEYFNAQFLTASNTIPVRGQGRKKSDDEKKALNDSKIAFRDDAKHDLNLPLNRPDPTGNGGSTGAIKILNT